MVKEAATRAWVPSLSRWGDGRGDVPVWAQRCHGSMPPGWSQADLATKINGDGGQISRYENGKITPSVEAIVTSSTAYSPTPASEQPSTTPAEDHSSTSRTRPRAASSNSR
ncbi:helix-turn-helix domain-containing protein [Nocardioides limicola]|uniref:helix-turn-helix domain-containing protein n=1 Tax=Nocardioides limicola TaxID=2803368 RepID=UPI00355784C0